MKLSTISRIASLGIGYCIAKQAFRHDVRVQNYQITHPKIKHDFRFVFISDLHNHYFGSHQKDLIRLIDQQRPDAVLLGGDFFDRLGNIEATTDLLTWLGRNYPSYYVLGNHEVDLNKDNEIKELVRLLNIHVLDGQTEEFSMGSTSVTVSGVDDYSRKRAYKRQLKETGSRLDLRSFNVLLSHHPQRVEDYQNYPFDLILTGHAHGGQVRIPGLLDGLFAPQQGFFPRYVGGKYILSNGATMIVNRGLASMTTRIPRIFNPPEINIIDLLKQ